MHYRRLRGEHPAPDEYEARFSQESLFTMPIEKTRATGELDTTSTVIPEKEQVWPHVLIAGYEILGELGKGGMGVVYKARHLRLNRVVALKMIRAGTDAHSEELLSFLNEARAVARLQHPNIVQIFEVGPEDSNSHSAPTFEGF